MNSHIIHNQDESIHKVYNPKSKLSRLSKRWYFQLKAPRDHVSTKSKQTHYPTIYNKTNEFINQQSKAQKAPLPYMSSKLYLHKFLNYGIPIKKKYN